MSEAICPVCGERDPYPKWICMARAVGEAEQGKPCSYSIEGGERMTKRMAEVVRDHVSRSGTPDAS